MLATAGSRTATPLGGVPERSMMSAFFPSPRTPRTYFNYNDSSLPKDQVERIAPPPPDDFGETPH